MEGWGEMASDELFNRITEEHLLDTIHKVKENQRVGLRNSREPP